MGPVGDFLDYQVVHLFFEHILCWLLVFIVLILDCSPNLSINENYILKCQQYWIEPLITKSFPVKKTQESTMLLCTTLSHLNVSPPLMYVSFPCILCCETPASLRMKVGGAGHQRERRHSVFGGWHLHRGSWVMLLHSLFVAWGLPKPCNSG